MSNARIPPLAPHEWTAEQHAILTADLGPGSPLGAARLGELALFTTLARHNGTFSSLLQLGRRLVMRAALPFADRELLILRTAWNCQSAYEWGQHARIAVHGGVDRAAVDRVPAGPDARGWSARQALLLRAADELHGGARIADDTWAQLAGTPHERQLIELPQLVGYSHLVAYVLGALQVVPEAGLEALPAAAG
jgi:alkylhydroperoxidase family enzyme